MKTLYVPQSKLSLIRGVVKEFNRELVGSNLSLVEMTVGEEVVRDWYITNRRWHIDSMLWKDRGLKRKVKLHPVNLLTKHPEFVGLNPLGYVNAQNVGFDQFLNEPDNCMSISFSRTPLSRHHIISVFDDNRRVKCECCNVSRNRGKAYVCEKDGEPFIFGASCFHKAESSSLTKLIKWHGYYGPLFEQFIKLIKFESRLVSVDTKAASTNVGMDLFLSGIHQIIRYDKVFVSSKGVMPTAKRCLDRINDGETFKSSKITNSFGAWVYQLSNTNQFNKRAKKYFFEACKIGVNDKNASMIAALYSGYLKEMKWTPGGGLELGFYSGIAKVSSVLSNPAVNTIELEDGYGRVFISTASLREKVGSIIFFSGQITSVEYGGTYPKYKIENFKINTI